MPGSAGAREHWSKIRAKARILLPKFRLLASQTGIWELSFWFYWKLRIATWKLASASELGDFYHLTELHELLGDFTLLEIGESFRLPDVTGLLALTVTLTPHARQDAGGLDTFGKASEDA